MITCKDNYNVYTEINFYYFIFFIKTNVEIKSNILYIKYIIVQQMSKFKFKNYKLKMVKLLLWHPTW